MAPILKSLLPVGLFTFCCFTLFDCSNSSSPQTVDGPLTVSGSTMGTYFKVTVASLPQSIHKNELRASIEDLLEKTNAQMSTYIPDSELSRFNQYEKTDWFPVSSETALVVEEALNIHSLTEGAFDVTVGPLVNLWGFGPSGGKGEIPSQEEINTTLGKVGSHHLQFRLAPPSLRKNIVDLYLDLSGIAKGFAVDLLSDYLESIGITDHLVDIGGEMKGRGQKTGGVPWKIAIERPVIDKQEIQQIINLSNQAIATSGDYRNYFDKDDQRYSHEVDSKTGKPIRHVLASVTVLDSSCMRADALATAFMVLGPQEGYRLAEREGLSALFIIKGEDGFFEKATTGYRNLTRIEK
ncbi:MAG: FAD:protein FMN transferase [Candidatus Latescibacteria bacterium]|nr:FAD:protein FMN transferase [Candidatus Latescibacterota bacterium]